MAGIRLCVDASKIEVLHSPVQFYERLIDLFSHAYHRVCISTLYVGTGPYSSAVIQAVHSALHTQGKKLKVDILMDKLRGSRLEGKPPASSLTLCQPLLQSQGNVRVSLFHNPLLRGWLHWLLPQRFNEMLGVMHVKAFLADDTTILSGANLSDTYLSNRQDRYIVIRNAEFTNIIHSIVNAIQEVSYSLNGDLSVAWDATLPNPMWQGASFKHFFGVKMQRTWDHLRKAELEPLLTAPTALSHGMPCHTPTSTQFSDTSQSCYIEIYLQAGFTIPSIRDEMGMLERVVDYSRKAGYSIIIASGYLNFPRVLLSAIRKFRMHCTLDGHAGGGEEKRDLNSSLKLITAAPAANSFFLSKGPSYYIPAAYSCTAAYCLEQIGMPSHPPEDLYEYTKPNWTFHSKGIWIYPENPSSGALPILTVVGSSNFGERAANRDLEMSFLMQTENIALRKGLQTEVDGMLNSCVAVSTEELQSRFGIWLKWIVLLIGKWFL